MGARAVLGVIPARYGASRFPGKPLALLWGRPLLQHVWERARRVAGLDHLIVESDPAVLASPDVVKVGVDGEGFALYFTRQDPAAGPGPGRVLRHVGVYGFARELLLEFASWPPGRLERSERLEQLRALERGVRIRVLPAAGTAAGVDTPEQLEALERRGPRAG